MMQAKGEDRANLNDYSLKQCSINSMKFIYAAKM